MSQKKQPKPFLKRGTRQFLSNATVRSLNQKPKIVDFEQQQQNFQSNTPVTTGPRRQANDIKIEIKVNSRPPIKKEEANRNSISKAKQNKNMNEDKDKEVSMKSNQLKKKNTVLDDYIGVKNIKKDSNPTRDSNTRQQINQNKFSYHSEPKISMVSQLKRQDQNLSSDEEKQYKQQRKQVKIKKAPTQSKYQGASNSKKVINIDVEEQNEKINFNSDSEQQVPKVKDRNSKPQIFPKPIEKKSRWQEEENEEKIVEQTKGPSKILQKYYKKQPQPQLNQKLHNLQKKQTTADIPRQLKQEIFVELLAQKHSDFTKKLDQLHSSIQKSKKQREALEEGTKQLGKEKQQFQRQMQKRKKEFEQKINSENSKLTRQKRYLKDHQTSGKVDWKVKNEVEQLRGKLQQCENDKKKLKGDLTRQIERLKKKLQEQQHETDMLKGQIRCIQMEKIQLKQKAKHVDKKAMVVPLRYWQDAPTSSYVSNFIEENFSLISLDPHYYNYESLEYYIYYLQKKDEAGELVSEQRDHSGSKITRKYKSGKEETQLISKSLKETFPPPFKFTIVNHANGDLKMILPEGIHVYFDSRNQITEWKINPDKLIHNFHKSRQIELKFKNHSSQIYQQNEKLLVRTQNQQRKSYRLNEKGELMRVG